MVFPPGTDNISYASIESDTDTSSYPSDNELTDTEADMEQFNWEVIKTFTDELRTSIDNYGSVVPCVNGTYLDDALWVTNYTVECSNVREPLMQLKSSTYWHDRAQDSFLTLFPGRHFNNHYQIRCFVLEHELVCIEQLFVHENFEFMAKDAHGLVTLLKQFSVPIVNLDTPKAIFDVTISRELTDPRLVDIYPFGAVADGLIHLEDVYHFYYTRVKDGIEPRDKVDMDIIDGVLVVFVGCNASRLKKHAWCPKDVGNISFSTPDDLIDYLRFQTSESS
uniref:Cell division cycle protein 123 n=1 Tax=Babesia bovis TaxID=5865 RepID=S6BNQ5_BABBO|nr:hypothetical protein [Babesia bovis]